MDLSIGQWAERACIWEATARKAGNVHPGREFADLRFADFLMSAAAIAPVFERAQRQSDGPITDQVGKHRRARVAGAAQSARGHHLQAVEQLENSCDHQQDGSGAHHFCLRCVDARNGAREAEQHQSAGGHEAGAQE